MAFLHIFTSSTFYKERTELPTLSHKNLDSYPYKGYKELENRLVELSRIQPEVLQR
jgi:hypothetical protein